MAILSRNIISNTLDTSKWKLIETGLKIYFKGISNYILTSFSSPQVLMASKSLRVPTPTTSAVYSARSKETLFIGIEFYFCMLPKQTYLLEFFLFLDILFIYSVAPNS